MATYLRLRSVRTGHQWNACEAAARAYLSRGGVEIVPGRSHISARPRPDKPLRDLAGKPARPRRRRAPGQTSKE